MNIATPRDSFAAPSAALKPRSPELRSLIARIGERASERDATRAHPYAEIDLIRSAKLGALRIPASHGGGGASLRELIETVVALGAADPNVAHALRNHFSFVERDDGLDQFPQRCPATTMRRWNAQRAELR